MSLKLSQVMLPVSDVDRAEAFYGHLLGSSGSRITADRLLFDCGGMVLTCYRPQVQPEAAPVSDLYRVYFAVENLEQIFQRAQEAGCQALDEEILTEPWGHRSFAAQDPFGNALSFLDETTARRLLEERTVTGPEERITTGMTLSVRSMKWGSEKQLAAAVTKIFTDQIWLKFSDSIAESPLTDEDRVQIQFWDKESAYLSHTAVVEVCPFDNSYAAIAVPDQAHELQRRTSPRVEMEAPFSFSVVEGSQAEASEGEVFSSQTSDVGVGGLRFETKLPLEEGSQLEMNFPLAGQEDIRVALKVVSSKQVDQEGEVVSDVGAQFVGMSLEDQIKVLKFLIDKQEGEEQIDTASSQPETPTDSSVQPESADMPPTRPGAAQERTPPQQASPAQEAVESPAAAEAPVPVEAAESVEEQLRRLQETAQSEEAAEVPAFSPSRREAEEEVAVPEQVPAAEQSVESPAPVEDPVPAAEISGEEVPHVGTQDSVADEEIMVPSEDFSNVQVVAPPQQHDQPETEAEEDESQDASQPQSGRAS